MDLGLFVVASLGVWRVTHLLHAEDGPFDLALRLRRAAGNGVLGRMLDCFKCTSVWVAMPFAPAVGDSLGGVVLGWLGLSGAAILVERVIHPPATWTVDPPADGDRKEE